MITILDEKKSRVESVYQYLKEKIIYDELTPGTLLREGDLATKLNVSKTPVREALNGLKFEGFVDVIPYKGYIVSRFSYIDLKDLFELRIILEKASVELAIQNITKNQLDHFKSLALREFDVDSVEARKEFMKVNIDFHSYLGEVSGNKQLAELLKNTIQKMQHGLFQALKESSLKTMVEEHLQIVEAIETKNESLAKSIVTKHARDSHLNILSINKILS
ncbi:GntR family transcriptional regulator [Neobacillus kokaensis]|uniref:GntR family transcriptional regulator n=1 Tax=Neobacillus kokaensis TaxID=2759023 RepID=A0ABQ3N543_9BACI|nr:GntR family transcriptional regulator [Neobacillus kokaensis]GHH99774.1 GntR family transcriptional regulator [Neobacillus kokaensis]